MRTDTEVHLPPQEPFAARVTGWSSLHMMSTQQTSPTVGYRVTQPINIFGIRTEALIDTGAQVSTISSAFIIQLLNMGIDVEGMVKEVPLNQACQVMDASGNLMRFTMLLEVPITIVPDGTTFNTVFHVVNGNTDESVLLGTNVLPSLGIFLSRVSSAGIVTHFTQSSLGTTGNSAIIDRPVPQQSLAPTPITSASSSTQPCSTIQFAHSTTAASDGQDKIAPISTTVTCKSVLARKRLVIPPHCTKVLQVSSSSTNEHTGVFWSSDEKLLTSGVISFAADGTARIPIHNNNTTSLRFLKQQVVGHTDTEDFRWKSISREDAFELLDHCPERVQLSEHQKKDKLLNIILEQNTVPADLQQLISEFADVFAGDDFELKRTHLVSHEIDTGDALPIRQKARPMPMGAKRKFKEILDSLLDKGIVEPSQSPWSSPIVLVGKRDGSLRLCVDYRELNKRIKLDSYPLPRMDDMLQSLSGKSVFSTLDLNAGFWQVPLEESSKEKTAFSTTEGLFQFNVLPFGLATSPATFQRLMATVLSDLIGPTNEVQVYIDDFLIATETKERHLVVLRQVFDALRTANLCLKPQKCSLLKSQVSYLGHRIDASGVHPDPDKIKAVQEFPQPTCLAEIRSFLGLCGYYRKFVHKFGAISKPLNELTSSSTPWEWTSARQDAFQTLKKVLCSAPVLAQPNFVGAQSGESPFFLYTDACKAGVGAVLCQEGKDKFLHPIHFVSKSLNSAESRYTISDLEGLAVVHSVQRLRSYLYDMHVIVRTDHQPLVSFFKSNTYGRVVRWALALQSYNKLRIEYVQGKSNVVADALSRGTIIREQGDESPTCQGQPECALLALQATNSNVLPDSWIELLRRDNDFGKIISAIEMNTPVESVKLTRMNEKVNSSQFSIRNNVLFFHTQNGDIRKVVPESLRKPLFQEVHAGIMAGHFGPNKIIASLKLNYFWPGLPTDIRLWHSECTQCYLTNNRDDNTPPLKPILRGKPYELVAVDLLELGITSSGNRYALVVVDHFSKFLGAYPIPNKSAQIVAETLVSRWICEGARWPKEILSDKGTEFLNQITETITKTTGISWITTKGYNPRENGLVERANATIKNALKKKVDSPAEWDKILPFVVYAYNTSPHDSTGESPFFLLHAFDPPSVASIDPPELTLWLADNVDYRAALVEGMQSAHTLAHEKLQQETEKMRSYYDRYNAVNKSWFPVIGDRVFLRNHPGTRSTHPKLTTDFSGPYRVLQCSENSALIVDIKGKNEPLHVPFDRVIRTPDSITDDEIGITRNKRRKQQNVRCNSIQLSVFSDHLHLVSKKNPLHPEYVCKGGPITSAICSTNLGACATTSAVLSQFVENSAPGTDTFRPASPIRLAQAIAAFEVYGPTTTAADETLMPSASLVSKDNLAPAIVKIAAQCAHIRNALKQMDTNIPYIFGLTTWGVSDAEVRVALGIAKKSIEAKEKPPTRTLLFMAEAVTKWTGPITGESVHLVQDVSYMPSKVSEALNDAQFKMYETRIILVVDGDVPTGFSVLDVLPTKTRSAAYSIFITCGPHGIGSSKIWMNQLMDLAIDLKANGNTKHGKVSSIADIGDGWTAFTVLGHKPSLPNRILPEYRVLEFFEALQVDSTFNDCPQVVIVKERKRKNEAAAGTYRKYDKK